MEYDWLYISEIKGEKINNNSGRNVSVSSRLTLSKSSIFLLMQCSSTISKWNGFSILTFSLIFKILGWILNFSTIFEIQNQQHGYDISGNIVC